MTTWLLNMTTMLSAEVSPQALERAHTYSMDDWVWEFAYDNWKPAALQETIFWFAGCGQAISHESTVEGWLASIKKGQLASLPRPAKDRWRGSQQIASILCEKGGSRAFGWFTEDPEEGWRLLQDIKYVGPKIAAWILRDLSLLRDYGADARPGRVEYHDHRDPSWFRKLLPKEQAFFLPLDRWVVRGAQRLQILPASLRMESLQDRKCYQDAALTLATWACEHELDARDLDVYLYLNGKKVVKRDGTTNVARGDWVWWTYDADDRVNVKNEWLWGEVVNGTGMEAVVRVEGQRRPSSTASATKSELISIPRLALRIERRAGGRARGEKGSCS